MSYEEDETKDSTISLFFVREEREVPDRYVEGRDYIFKYPLENRSLFEAEELIKAFEIEDDCSEVFEFIENIILIDLREVSQNKRKVFAKKTNKKLLNDHVDELDRHIPKIIESLSSGEKNLKEQNDLMYDFALSLVGEFIESEIERAENQSEFEEKLDKIDHGLLLKNKEGESIWFNSVFRLYGLNPSELPIDMLENSGSQQFSAMDRHWQIQSLNLKDSYQLIIITEVETGEGMQNNEELGIISSSIAHELNNPLGGISAAIDVLMLDDDLSEQTLESLQNIKETVYRCKGLVQTFLGFSKKEISDSDVVDWNRIFDQAYDLLKFRMVESHLKLNYQIKQSGIFPVRANSSVLTMVFYLMFNEFLTVASHRDLVESSESRKIDLEILETSSEILIQSDRAIDSVKLPQEKLLRHLLQIYDMKLATADSGFSISIKP